MRVKFADVGGILTRYIVAGSGYPLILLHGVGLSADTFLHNLEIIGERYRVYALDMLGHGFTDIVDFGSDAPHQHLVDHVERFATTLGIGEFALGGSSFGAQIAVLLQLQQQSRVSDLIVIGSGSCFNTEEQQARSLKDVYRNAMSALEDPTWESCERRLDNICYDRRCIPSEIILSQLTSYARPGLKTAYESTVRGMTDLVRSRPYRIFERLHEIRVPTLIIWGKQDTRGRYERAVLAQQRIPDARLVLLDKCGHLPYLERPELFNTEVLGFLDERHAPGGCPAAGNA